MRASATCSDVIPCVPRIRDTRQAKLAMLQAQVAKQNQYLTDHPRAHAQGAWQKLVARAKTLRIADW